MFVEQTSNMGPWIPNLSSCKSQNQQNVCKTKINKEMFCPCGTIMKPWRNEHQLEMIKENTHLTNDCKETGMFHNPDELMRHILSNKKECIIHYAMFESLLKMYPKLVNQLLPIILINLNNPR